MIYGFWTMFITGSGHGNFLWIFLFIFPEFFGLYFPIMSVLALNLKSLFSKLVYWGLIIFNVVASSVFIYGWVTDERPSDYGRQIQVNGFGFVIFCVVLHFLPTLAFACWFVVSTLRRKEELNDDSLIELKLV